MGIDTVITLNLWEILAIVVLECAVIGIVEYVVIEVILKVASVILKRRREAKKDGQTEKEVL